MKDLLCVISGLVGGWVATSYGVTAMSLDHYRVEDAFLPWLEAY